MRTTITLPDGLLRDARKRAADTGRSVSAVIEDCVRAGLESPRAESRRRTVKLPVEGGRGPAPPWSLIKAAEQEADGEAWRPTARPKPERASRSRERR